jgi:hypothetical protein
MHNMLSRRCATLSVLASILKRGECWIRREQQSLLPDAKHVDYKDVNFGFEEQSLESLQERHNEHVGHVRHRVLKKSSKKGATGKQSKKSSEAGFLDEDFMHDFDEMFGMNVSEYFSLEHSVKSSKASKQSKKSSKQSKKSSKQSKKSSKQSKKSNKAGGVFSMDMSMDMSMDFEVKSSKQSKKSRKSDDFESLDYERKGSKKLKGSKKSKKSASKKEVPKLTRPPVGMYTCERCQYSICQR